MRRRVLALTLLSALLVTGCGAAEKLTKQTEIPTKRIAETNTGAVSESDDTGHKATAAYPRSVMVGGIIYQDTGYVDSLASSGMMDGKITSAVDGSKLPVKNDQSNFGSGYEYRLSDKDRLVVRIDGQSVIFRNIDSEDDSIPVEVMNFKATVKEIKNGALLVTCVDAAEGFGKMSGDYAVSAETLKDKIAAGDTVRIWFDGSVSESSPRRIDHVYRISRLLPSAENKLTWAELSESGVDEKLLWQSINQEDLKNVAARLQAVVRLISEKGEADRTYWLTPQWLADAKNSEQYKKVIAMGSDAVKPLYLIIYKSPTEGLYEYICAMALDELTGFKIKDEYPGTGWVTSKDFLRKFNARILEKQRPAT